MGKMCMGNKRGAVSAKAKATRVKCNTAAARGAKSAAGKGQSGRNKKQGCCSNGGREEPASGSGGGSQKNNTSALYDGSHGQQSAQKHHNLVRPPLPLAYLQNELSTAIFGVVTINVALTQNC